MWNLWISCWLVWPARAAAVLFMFSVLVGNSAGSLFQLCIHFVGWAMQLEQLRLPRAREKSCVFCFTGSVFLLEMKLRGVESVDGGSD